MNWVLGLTHQGVPEFSTGWLAIKDLPGPGVGAANAKTAMVIARSHEVCMMGEVHLR